MVRKEARLLGLEVLVLLLVLVVRVLLVVLVAPVDPPVGVAT